MSLPYIDLVGNKISKISVILWELAVKRRRRSDSEPSSRRVSALAPNIS